jgi:serine/threonine protein kinase
MDEREEDERDEEELGRLFLEFAEALEGGRDVEAELVARAGALGERLRARIRVHRDLTALSEDMGLARAKPVRIGRFEVRRLLGSGGISRVYEAHDPRLGRTVALKVLDRKGMLDRTDRAWVLNEGRSLARITHRNVARIYDVGEIDDDPYIAMELLAGPSLAEVIRHWRRERDSVADGPAPDPSVLALAARYGPYSARIALLADLAGALAHCHDHGILHRDVKPANVLFDAEGQPRLIDFGLAHVEGADEDSRLGLTQALVGTAAYIAPEQVTSDATGADPRSDQFSLGTLAYELFALENPFQRPSRHAILAAVEAAEPAPLATRARALPPDLPRVVHHALAKDPAARYPDLAAFAGDLRAILAHRPISVAEPSLGALARLWLRRHGRNVRLAVAASLSLTVILASAWTVRSFRERARLLRGLASIAPGKLTEREQFGDAYVRMEDLDDEVREFDSSWIRRIAFGGLSDELRSAIADLSRDLGEFARNDPELTPTGPPTPAEGTYQILFQLDAALFPDGRANDDLRRRGQVVYPDVPELELALFRLATDSTPGFGGLSRLAPVPRNQRLERGVYRLQAWRRGTSATVLGEIEFTCEGGWKAPIQLDFATRNPELVSATRAIPEGMLSAPEGELRVPAFRILDHLVTVAEYARFLEETKKAPTAIPPGLDVLPATGSSAARASFDDAALFARWVGGRLPTVVELERADEVGNLLPDEPVESFGEYVSDPQPQNAFDRMWLEYVAVRPFKARTRPVMDRSIVVFGGTTGAIRAVAFRVVFSEACVPAPE